MNFRHLKFASLLLLPVAGAALELSNFMNAPKIYKEIVGDTANPGANDGIMSYLSKTLDTNPCLQASVRMFYKSQSPEWFGSSKSVMDGAVPNSLGSEKDASGSVYQAALKFFGGDGDLATVAIGVCGHDDVSNGLVLSRNSSPVLASFQDPNPIYKNALLNCPEPDSPMYAPNSIGVDIRDELREKIASIQAPTAGAKVLPAKYYHTITGSLIGCIMKQKGVPEPVTAGIDAAGVRDYRALRLAGQLRSALQNYGKELMPLEKYENAEGFAGHNLKVQDAESKRLIHRAAIFLQKQEALKDRDLTKDYGPEGNLGLAMAVYKALEQAIEKKKDCKTEQERCVELYQKLQTWMVDSEWSEQAHMAGLHAAYQRCSDLTQGKSLEQKACDFVKSNPEKMPKPLASPGAIQ